MQTLLGRLAIALNCLWLVSCATTPQAPVALSPAAMSATDKRIGVAMSALPKVDTTFPGAGCLLCAGAAALANKSLTTQTQTLPYEDLPKLGELVAAELRAKGLEVSVINEPIDADKLGSFDGGLGYAKKDHSPLQSKYNIQRLVFIQITGIGIVRTYNAYFPSSDPKAYVRGVAYLVNLSSNQYEWYQPIDFQKAAEGSWDEPPKFPGLTNAYFQVLELTKDAVLDPFHKSPGG